MEAEALSLMPSRPYQEGDPSGPPLARQRSTYRPGHALSAEKSAEIAFRSWPSSAGVTLPSAPPPVGTGRMSHPSSASRLIPSRGAAVALLTLDVALVSDWAAFSWNGSWFPVVYTPIGATVGLGVLMSGYGATVGKILALGSSLMGLSLGGVLLFRLVSFNQLDTLLRVFGWGLGMLITLTLAFAVVGWTRFFIGRPAVE